MKRLLIFLAINLGLNGIILGAAPAAPTIPVPTQISNQEAKDASSILDLATKGVSDLTTHTQKIEQAMNSMQTQALSDANLGKNDTFQGYITRIVNTVTDGQNSLESLADIYKNQIDFANKTAAAGLDSLAGTDSANKTAADASKNILNSQALNSRGQIDTARDANVAALTTLRTTIQTTIESTHNTLSSADNSSSQSVGDKVLSYIENFLGSPLKDAAGVLIAYFAKQILCKFGVWFGTCPPVDENAQQILKKLGLSENIDELLAKVGCSKVSELIDGGAKSSKALMKAVKQEFAKKYGMAEGKVNELVTKAAKSVGASDQDISKFLDKVSEIKIKLVQALPGLAEEHLLPKIGDALSKATGQDINIDNIVQQIKATMAQPAEPPVINTGSKTNNPSDLAEQRARTSELNEIKQKGLTRKQVIDQIAELERSIALLKGEQKTAAEEKIAASEEIIKDTDPAAGKSEIEDPFVE